MTLAFLALVLASIADAVTTRLALQCPGVEELNPMMRWSTRTLSRALATKAIGLTWAGWATSVIAATQPVWAFSMLVALTVWTTWLAWGNWQLRRALLAA